MKNFAITLFTIATLFAVTSCTRELEPNQNGPDPTARELLSTHTYYSEIPGSGSHVYSLTLSQFSDGTADVERTIVPASPLFTVLDGIFVGENSITATGSFAEGVFTSDAWYVPFNPAAAPVFLVAGGSVTCLCDCSGGGGCNAKVSVGPSGSSCECTVSTCSGSCAASMSAAGFSGGPGLAVAASAVNVM